MLHPILATGQVSPFYAFEQSDNFGRCIVFLLFCASIIAWTIMIDKYLMLKKTRKHCSQLLTHFKTNSTWDFLLNLNHVSGPMAAIAQAANSGLGELLSVPPDEAIAKLNVTGGKLTPCDTAIRRLRSMAESQVDEEIIEIEQRLGLLSSIVSASPFLGLLGTVWGVMMAFSGMAMHGKADIGAIAPGVSGALLTTVVGLLVAIPAVIGYNILVNQVKEISVDLDNFAENLITKIEVAMNEGQQG